MEVCNITLNTSLSMNHAMPTFGSRMSKASFITIRSYERLERKMAVKLISTVITLETK